MSVTKISIEPKKSSPKAICTVVQRVNLFIWNTQRIHKMYDQAKSSEPDFYDLHDILRIISLFPDQEEFDMAHKCLIIEISILF